MNEEMESSLKKIILKNSTITEQDVTIGDETNLIKELYYNSLSFVKLIIDIEAAFDIEIPDEDIEFDTIGNYGNLKNCIEKLRQ